jgi:protein O-GlcNAc transferase
MSMHITISFNKLGEHQKAISCYEKAIQIQPHLTSQLLCMNTFPVIYKNYEEINHYNYKFKKNIDKINKLLDVKSNYSKNDIIRALNSSTNFFLHYQGKDILELQRDYAQLIERITIFMKSFTKI